MITTTTTGTCDRCKKEVDRDFYKATIATQQHKVIQYATTFPLYTDGITLNLNHEGYHICQDCLDEFRKFVKND